MLQNIPSATGAVEIPAKAVPTTIQRELKYVFPNSRARILRDWLDARCRPDPDFAAGQVISIYFDTFDGALRDEKVNSDYLKTKVRLRWYGNWTTGAPGGGVFLEVKQRFGSGRDKFRRALPLPAAAVANMALEDPRFLGINRIVGEAGFRFTDLLRPVLQLAYRRRRYIEAATGSRICLDQDIRLIRAAATRGWAAGNRPIPEGVFEVKGTVTKLPETLHPLIAQGCRLGAFSKYLRCFEQLQPLAC